MCLVVGFVKVGWTQSSEPSATTDSVVVTDVLPVDKPPQGELAAGDGSPLPEWHAMVTRVPGDWGRFVGKIFRANTIPSLLGLGGVTAALMVSDHDTWRATHDVFDSSPAARDMGEFIVTIGDGKTHLGLAGAFALYGFVADDNRALRTGSQIIEAFLSTGTTVQLLKHTTGRERPERQSKPKGRWNPLPNQKAYHRNIPKYDAFPSGHISTTFATLTVIAENYRELRWFRPASYVLTGLVGIALAGKGWHWYSDFPLGIALGYQYGMIAAHPEGLNLLDDEKPNAARLSVSPMAIDDGAGISIDLDF